MEDRVNTKIHCRYCREELTVIKKTGCRRCLNCHPINDVPVVPFKKETKYVDITLTEGRVREIVRDELENWHLQKPSVTKDEITSIVEEPESWRQTAKRLGISLSQATGGVRKKVDVLADIKEAVA